MGQGIQSAPMEMVDRIWYPINLSAFYPTRPVRIVVDPEQTFARLDGVAELLGARD